MLTDYQLRVLRGKSASFLRRWIERGNKITAYFCGNCKLQITTHCPNSTDVGEKGCWDSMVTCTQCGNLSFVSVYPDGKTIAKQVF